MTMNELQKNYSLMSEDNKGYKPEYQPGKFWQNINKNFADDIYHTDMSKFRDGAINQRYAAPHPTNRQVYRALLNLYYKYLADHGAREFLETHHEPSYGGTENQELYPFPHGALLYPFEDHRPMSLDFLQSTDEAQRITNAFRNWYAESPRVILELGGGYGRLGYVLRKMLPDCIYIAVDLPESLAICGHYLSNVLPNEVFPYHKSRNIPVLDRKKLLEQRVWLLGTEQIESIPDKSVDVFINIYSMSEMQRTTMRNYIFQADRITKHLVYLKQRKEENNKLDDVQITARDYDTMPNWTTIISQDATLYPDFFERIYRINDDDA
jgi:hypothetical protein